MSVAFDISPSPPAEGDHRRSSARLVEPRHPALGREDVRRGLVAILRRRVPGQDVDDLAQTILCDALAAGTMPADEEELRRWLVGIARHKIADYHRRAHRVSARTDGEAPLANCATSPAAFEEREVLQHLLDEVRSRRDAETMEWLVREHGGERLADIADENELSAPVVRQRVSRLRRALRSRWSTALGLLVLIAGAAAYALTREKVAIQPEKPPVVIELPAKPKPVNARPTFLDDIQGEWKPSSFQFAKPLAAPDQKLFDDYAHHVQLVVDGDQFKVTVGKKFFKETWTISATDGESVTLLSDHGFEDHVQLKYWRDDRGPHIEVRLEGHPRLPNIVRFQRPVY